jgi:methyl-accepting chemotaxis protein
MEADSSISRQLTDRADRRLGFWQRLSTRMLGIQALILLAVVLVSSVLYHETELDEAKQTLITVGQTLLPFMAPAIRPALDLAFDSHTGRLDPDLIQLHIVQSAFAVAKKNSDLIYADLLLPTGTSVQRFMAPGIAAQRVDQVYGNIPLLIDKVVTAQDIIAHQTAIFTPDASAHLGTLRVAFSLARVRERSRRTLLMTYAAGAVFFFLGLGLTAATGRSVVYGPLARLLEGARRIARGELKAKPLHVPPGEFSLLVEAFTTMTDALRELVLGVKNTSSGVQHAVRVVQERAQNMLGGARRQSSAMVAISDSTTQLDVSSQKVEQSVASFRQASLAAAQSTQGLSRSLTELTPEVDTFSKFAVETDTALKQMTQRANDIGDLVNSMAESTNSTASTVQEFDQAIQMIGAHAMTASEVSASVMHTAADGQAAVKESVAGMGQINSAFDAISQAVQRLGESMASIGEIVRAISTISDQTKLLSLNASILAAQAGEHGAGFSVVADEVKGLSERTMAATREIQKLIGRLDEEQQATVHVMTQGLSTVRRGSDLAKLAGSAIEQIMKHTGDNHMQMKQIAAATSEQVKGSKYIAEATQKIAEMGQKILTAAQEQTSAAQSITSMSAKVVSSAQHMQSTLSQQAASGLHVTQDMGKMAQKAADLAQEIATQKVSRTGIATHVGELKNLADAIVSEAEQVAKEVEGLSRQTEQVRDSIEHFRLE